VVKERGLKMREIGQTGRYLITWWVATQSSLGLHSLSFAVVSSQGNNINAVSPIKTGEVIGIAIIEVDSIPMTLRLISQIPTDVWVFDTS
jgi:hypothetical protein